MEKQPKPQEDLPKGLAKRTSAWYAQDRGMAVGALAPATRVGASARGMPRETAAAQPTAEPGELSDSPSIEYIPWPGVTPEEEAETLARVYAFLLDKSRESRGATEAAEASGHADDGGESL